MDASQKGPEPEAPEQALPKLSVQEFRQYNRLAEHMDMFVRPRPPLTATMPDTISLADPRPNSTRTFGEHGQCSTVHANLAKDLRE